MYSFVLPVFYQDNLGEDEIPIRDAVESEHYYLTYKSEGLTHDTVNDELQKIVDMYGRPNAVYVEDRKEVENLELTMVHVFEEKMIITEIVASEMAENPEIAFRLSSRAEDSFSYSDSPETYYIIDRAAFVSDFS